MLNETRNCNRCGIEKSIKDFYAYTNFTLKSICKSCEINSINKYKLWYCDYCDINIRNKNKSKHLKSKRHLNCYFHGEKYNSNNLQLQNKRKITT
jgi:hypothetical protein